MTPTPLPNGRDSKSARESADEAPAREGNKNRVPFALPRQEDSAAVPSASKRADTPLPNGRCEACENHDSICDDGADHGKELHAEIARLRVQVAVHHFGDHGEECDNCGEPYPSEHAIAVLQPLGIVNESGSILYGTKVKIALTASGSADCARLDADRRSAVSKGGT